MIRSWTTTVKLKEDGRHNQPILENIEKWQ